MGRERHLAESTHIRLLVFSPVLVESVRVTIDGVEQGTCTRAQEQTQIYSSLFKLYF